MTLHLQVTSQRDITVMAGAPRPPLHWEQQRAANIVRLLSLYRPLLDSYIIVSVPSTSSMSPACPQPCVQQLSLPTGLLH